MTVPGYATDVLVDADWAKSHLDDPNVRFVEVDVDTAAYEQSHLPGAVGWNWTSQLADGIRRDIASRDDFSALLSASGIGPDTTDRPVRRQQQLVRRLGLLAAQAVRPLGRPHPQRRPQVLARQRPAGDAPTCRPIPTTGYAPARARLRLRAFRDDILPRLGDPALVAGGRPLPGRVHRRDHRAAGHDRDGPAGRPHPGRRQHPVGADRPRGRHLQEPRRAAEPVRGQGRDARQGRHRLLPDRRAQQPLLVRPPRAAGLSAASATTTARGPSGARMVGVPIEKPVAVTA